MNEKDKNKQKQREREQRRQDEGKRAGQQHPGEVPPRTPNQGTPQRKP